MDDPTQPARRPDPDPGTEPEMPAVQADQPVAPQAVVAGPVAAPYAAAPVTVVGPLPGSVIGAAIVLLVMGVLSVLFAAVLLLSVATYGQLPDSNFGDLTPDQAAQARNLGRAFITGFAVVAGVVALGHLASGIGILRRAGWGRLFGMIFAGLGLLFTGLLALGALVLMTAQLPAATITESGMTPEQFAQFTRLAGGIGAGMFGVMALAYLFTLIALIRNGRAFD
jgi:hypothetical protein